MSFINMNCLGNSNTLILLDGATFHRVELVYWALLPLLDTKMSLKSRKKSKDAQASWHRHTMGISSVGENVRLMQVQPKKNTVVSTFMVLLQVIRL